jgi:5-bromo-4-chloroindolyl phosphate hydrolysis protein
VKKDNWVSVALPLLIAVVVFALSIIISQWAFVIAVVLALCSYAGLSFLFTPIVRLGGLNIEHIKNREEILTLLEEGEKDLASIKTIIETSKDPKIKTRARNVYREGSKIVEYIKKNPAKVVMARRFFNYYLDKANEILTKYHNVISTEIETDHLGPLTEKTLSGMEAILKGMNLQFSRLISSEVIDVEAEVKLLESTVRMEDS